MNRHVNAIAGRLSLRDPQRRSLELLDRVTELVPLKMGADLKAALAAIRSEFPTVTDFEREFPSLCFALATGVGKTRLMGAFITYLYLAHGIKNFFVLAPNLTIYNKLIADFTRNTPKYVFQGISQFATTAPLVITGDDYETLGGGLLDRVAEVKINIFNISKINSEVRGGKSPRIKRLSEYLGASYFDYLAQIPDLVLLMDESHRYRASAGIRAINELKPVLGLELTATPFVETGKGAVAFKNVIHDYPLGQAMIDGFVKEPAVVTRKDFNPSGMSPQEVEQLKLEDGIRLHESVKVELETYARETGNVIVKPFVLVIARDTTHAAQLLKLIESDAFFEGRYRGKALQVDSSRTGAEEDEMVQRLLKVEHADEPTEIVIHVNMLKEGWDVTNLYTIVPLRAANAKILIEQSIGRGLRLPYGKRTGVMAVDRLNIVAHDKFQEIVDEANRPGSTIRLQKLILEPDQLERRTETVVARPQLELLLGVAPEPVSKGAASAAGAITRPAPAFTSPSDLALVQIALGAIRTLSHKPGEVPGVSALSRPEVQRALVREVERQAQPTQLELPGTSQKPDVTAIVERTTALVIEQTIDIPRIQVVPRGEVRSGFHPFKLDVSAIRYAAPSDAVWIHHLRTNETETLDLAAAGGDEPHLENYIVRCLVDFDDISYDLHAELLYDLSGQVVRHLQGYLSEEDVIKVLQLHQRDIARFIHAQMARHHWEDASGYEAVVSQGFIELKPCAFTAPADEAPLDFHYSPANKSNMARYVFGGFQRCLYRLQKFQSDSERRLSVILERDSLKWFKPVKGQFQLFYKDGTEHREYQPDFVAETATTIYMLEPKARNELNDPIVLAKRDAAVKWCKLATDHAKSYHGKPWVYALIPHDDVEGNMSLPALAAKYGVKG